MADPTSRHPDLRPVVIDHEQSLWALVRDSNGLITSNDLSPSFKIRLSGERKLSEFRHVLPRIASRPSLHVAAGQADPSAPPPKPPPKGPPGRPSKGPCDRRPLCEVEVNILRDELARVELEHERVRKLQQLSDTLVHGFCAREVARRVHDD